MGFVIFVIVVIIVGVVSSVIDWKVFDEKMRIIPTIIIIILLIGYVYEKTNTNYIIDTNYIDVSEKSEKFDSTTEQNVIHTDEDKDVYIVFAKYNIEGSLTEAEVEELLAKYLKDDFVILDVFTLSDFKENQVFEVSITEK